MIHFKNLKKNLSSGFSFMEVMVAIVMLGMLMTAILTLQNTTFTSVVTFSKRLRTMFLLKNRLVEAAFNRVTQKEEKKSTGETTAQTDVPEIKYALEKINEKSSLKKFEHCFIEKARAQWQEGKKKNQETLCTFLYKAPEKKENEKK